VFNNNAEKLPLVKIREAVVELLKITELILQFTEIKMLKLKTKQHFEGTQSDYDLSL
jgi:hypothetical protein